MIDMLFVSFDNNGEDKPFMVVGKGDPTAKTINIVNTFEGEQAIDIFNMLTSPATTEQGE